MKIKPDVVVHTCNSSYSGGRQRQEDGELEATLGKALSQKQIQTKRLGVWFK
jgi:hypothetical protein